MKPPVRKQRFDEIAEAVATFYRVRLALMKGRSRAEIYASPRQVGMYLSLRLTGATLQAVSKYWNRNHSTVRYGFYEVERCMRESPAFAGEVAQIERQLTPAGATEAA